MARRSNGSSACLEFERDQLRRLVKQFPVFESFDSNFYGSTKAIPVRLFNKDHLEWLYREMFQNTGTGNVIKNYIGIFDNPSQMTVGNLKRLEPGLCAWLKENMIRCWVFDVDGQPYLVTKIEYYPNDTDSPATVQVTLRYWNCGTTAYTYISFYSEDLRGTKSSINELMANKGFVHETPQLIAEYDRTEAKFFEMWTTTGTQYETRKRARVVNDSVYGPESSQFHYSRRKDNEDYGSFDHLNVVNSLFTLGKIDDDDSDEALKVSLAATRIPIFPQLYCFDLVDHTFEWIHIGSLRPYVYKPEIKDKLVLPPDHTDLIEALTSDLDIITQDIVEGKSGGTIILGQGLPGTGKTLTAEIYAEVCKRPLYRVHSGQLGTQPKEVETALQLILKRAERWKAILLLDEADIFVKERGDDMNQNAVVGVFLRTLEYFSGLLFMTTNRLAIIDDAIASRCIAIIRYEVPGYEQRKKIWKILSDQIGMPLEDDLIDELARRWAATGRDIKGLTRLTQRFVKGRKPTINDFIRMSNFKGLALDK